MILHVFLIALALKRPLRASLDIYCLALTLICIGKNRGVDTLHKLITHTIQQAIKHLVDLALTQYSSTALLPKNHDPITPLIRINL